MAKMEKKSEGGFYAKRTIFLALSSFFRILPRMSYFVLIYEPPDGGGSTSHPPLYYGQSPCSQIGSPTYFSISSIFCSLTKSISHSEWPRIEFSSVHVHHIENIADLKKNAIFGQKHS